MERLKGNISSGLDPDYFEVAENVSMNFPVAICEILDNSIAATTEDQNKFIIDVFIALISPNELEITIIDSGSGIQRDIIQKGMFILARSPDSTSRPYGKLNEHGMGLKNVLPWLTKHSKRQFDLRTSFFNTNTNCIEYSKVQGTLKVEGMIWEESSISEWNEWMNPRNPKSKTGTKLRFRCHTSQAFSGWEDSFGIDRTKIDFKFFSELLDEYLSVTYKKLLTIKDPKEDSNSIRTTYWNTNCYKRPFQRTYLKPLEIIYKKGWSAKNDLYIHCNGKIMKVGYSRGFVDDHFSSMRKAFYARNERAQGYDVILHGKVIQSRIYEQIWTTKRNNAQNGFTGEIILETDDLNTVLTKDKLDWGLPILREMSRRIVALDKTPGQLFNTFKPRPKYYSKNTKYRWYGNEDELANLLFEAIQKVLSPGCSVKRHDPCWDPSKTGIDPKTAEDITYEDSNGFYLIEAKMNKAQPLHLYQIRMYWDGFCLLRPPSKAGPTKAFLIADNEPRGVSWLRKSFLSSQKDPLGNEYKIHFRTWKSFGLPPLSKGGGADLNKVRDFLTKIDTCK